MPTRSHFNALFVAIVLAALILGGPHAHAYEWSRPLSAGDSGKDVKALQMRIAGWFPDADKERFLIDGAFGPQTEAALVRFQRHYGLADDGSAGKRVYAHIEKLTDEDGSTKHFDWSEFAQNENSSCPRTANKHAGTFGGGAVKGPAVRRNVRAIMWRLEAIRAKAGGVPIGINSGFRSLAYNKCIGGARASQHVYGTAADIRVVATDNHKARVFARRSQISGIGCYAELSHNHFDIRIENRHNENAAFWWWPKRDRKGRDLDWSGDPCWGERRRSTHGSRFIPPTTTQAVLTAISRLVPGVGSYIPGAVEVAAFATAGETELYGLD